MPTSNLACAPEVLDLVAGVPHARVLDVGPGRGKYGVLLREYVADVGTIHAVEAWSDYITPRLEAIYDLVIPRDVMELTTDGLAFYDLVLMVDVIEHLTHDDGEALLDCITGSVVICTPRDYFQNPEARTIWTEDHRSHWKVEEFQAMSRCDVAYVNAVGAVMARLRAK